MKRCTKCSEVKPYEQFSKNRKAKDGLQWHCKECNNKDNYRFRHEIDPEYMNRWFNTHRKQWQTYMNDYTKVGNTNTIYSITAPNADVYIGFTQRKKYLRLSEHKKYYKLGTKNKMPLLWESFDRYGIDNHKFEVLKQFEGTRSEGMEIESNLIHFYKSINKSLNVKD